MQHPQNDERVFQDLVGSNVGSARDHELPCVGNPTDPTHPRLLRQQLHRLEDALGHTLCCLWIILSDLRAKVA
jgi:hypothetical protein